MCYAQVSYQNRSKLLKLSGKNASVDVPFLQAKKEILGKRLRTSAFSATLKIPFNKDIEDIGFNRVIKETIAKFSSYTVAKRNSHFFKDLNVLVSYKSAQKIGDI